jgi:hypothetical protein
VDVKQSFAMSLLVHVTVFQAQPERDMVFAASRQLQLPGRGAAKRTANFAVAVVAEDAHVRRRGTALAAAVTVGPRRTWCIGTTYPWLVVVLQLIAELMSSLDMTDGWHILNWRQGWTSGLRLTAEVRLICRVVAADAGAALALAEAGAARGTCRQ